MKTSETAWTTIKPQLESVAAKACERLLALRVECRSRNDVFDLLGAELGVICVALVLVLFERALFHRWLDPAVIVRLADWWAIAFAVAVVIAAPFLWLREREEARQQVRTKEEAR